MAVRLPRLHEYGLSLLKAVDFAIKRFPAVQQDKESVRDPINEFLASKEQRFDRADLRSVWDDGSDLDDVRRG